MKDAMILHIIGPLEASTKARSLGKGKRKKKSDKPKMHKDVKEALANAMKKGCK